MSAMDSPRVAPIKKTMRPAAIAGRFYSGEANALIKEIDEMFTGAEAHRSEKAESGFPKALIVPHAGYRYSGEVAASAYQTIRRNNRHISRVVLIGPSHRVRFEGLAATSADYFATPLGNIPIDMATIRQSVAQFPFIALNNKAHQHEHALETQLPFLQRCLGQFSLIPIAVGAATPEQVAKCLRFLWGGRETLILISSDLSHYRSYADAQEIDQFTSRAIESLNPDPITYQHACGQLGVRGLLQIAQEKKLMVRTLDVRNSGDTFGPKESVVGYGSYGFYPPPGRVNRRQRAELTRIAWASIDHGFKNNVALTPSLKGYGALFTEPGACFVTLSRSNGELRGCIGSLTSQTPLLVNVSHNAWKSAFIDHRFKPLTTSERQQTRLEISVLSPSELIHGKTEDEIVEQIRPFVDGLIFVDQGKRGTFLPSVWKTISDRNTFFKNLKLKGGFAEDYWSDTVKVYRYQTETW